MDQKSRNEEFNKHVKMLFDGSSWKNRAIAAQKLGHLKEGRATNLLARVLKSEKSAIVVVGNSTLAGLNSETSNSLVEIGKGIGFEVPMVGVRQLDRNRRMLPASSSVNKNSQIQQRMHEEFVIGFYKP